MLDCAQDPRFDIVCRFCGRLAGFGVEEGRVHDSGDDATEAMYFGEKKVGRAAAQDGPEYKMTVRSVELVVVICLAAKSVSWLSPCVVERGVVVVVVVRVWREREQFHSPVFRSRGAIGAVRGREREREWKEREGSLFARNGKGGEGTTLE